MLLIQIKQFFDQLIRKDRIRSASPESSEKERETPPAKRDEPADEKTVLFQKFEDEIGYVFQDKQWLEDILYRTNDKKIAFFGDSVLEILTAEFLYLNCKDYDRGELTALKSYLVNDEKLDRIVRQNGWENYLVPENGICRTSMKMNSTFLEAIIGAVYLDGGSVFAAAFVSRYIVNPTEIEKEKCSILHPKVRLIEFCQKNYGGHVPEPFLISRSGPPHDSVFVMGIFLPRDITGLDEDIYGVGQGRTKSAAEKKAAESVNNQLIRRHLMEEVPNRFRSDDF